MYVGVYETPTQNPRRWVEGVVRQTRSQEMPLRNRTRSKNPKPYTTINHNVDLIKLSIQTRRALFPTRTPESTIEGEPLCLLYTCQWLLFSLITNVMLHAIPHFSQLASRTRSPKRGSPNFSTRKIQNKRDQEQLDRTDLYLWYHQYEDSTVNHDV